MVPAFEWMQVEVEVTEVERALAEMLRLLREARMKQAAARSAASAATAWMPGGEDELVAHATPSLGSLPAAVLLLMHIYEGVLCAERAEYGPTPEPVQEPLRVNDAQVAVWARLLRLSTAPLHLGLGPHGDVAVQAVSLYTEGACVGSALAWSAPGGGGRFLRFFGPGESLSTSKGFLEGLGLSLYELGSLAPISGGELALLRIHPHRLGEALGLSTAQAECLQTMVCWECAGTLPAALERGASREGGPGQTDWGTILHKHLPPPMEGWLVRVSE